MKLWINIDDKDKFQLSVGHGRQTFKWLAILVSKRLCERKGISAVHCLPPQRVDTAQGALATKYGVAPSERIKDVVKDNSEVFFTYHDTRALDVTGALATTPWQDEAFRRDPSAAYRRRQRILDYDRQQKTAARLNKLRSAAVGVGSSIVLQNTLWEDANESDATPEQRFRKDWLRLQCLVMVTAADREEVKAVLWQHYQTIRDVFRWYSNIMGQTQASSPDAFAMDRAEWDAFIADCRIVTSTNFAFFKPGRVFYRACKGLKTMATKDEPLAPSSPTERKDMQNQQLDRVTFMDALCLVAATVQNGGERFGFVDDLPPLRPNTLKDFLVKFVVPRGKRVMGTSDVRRQLTEKGVARQIVREIDMLRSVYQEYCKKGLSRRLLAETTPGTRTMTRSQFKTLLVDCGLYLDSRTPRKSPRPTAGAAVSMSGGTGSSGAAAALSAAVTRGSARSIVSTGGTGSKGGAVSPTAPSHTLPAVLSSASASASAPSVGGFGVSYRSLDTGGAATAGGATAAGSGASTAAAVSGAGSGASDSKPFAVSRSFLPAIDAVRRATAAFKLNVGHSGSSGVVSIRPGGALGGSTDPGSGRELTERDLALAFLLSMVEDDGALDGLPEEEVTTAITKALARIALQKWPTDSLPTQEKLALVIDAIAIHHSSTGSGLADLGSVTELVKRLKNVETAGK